MQSWSKSERFNPHENESSTSALGCDVGSPRTMSCRYISGKVVIRNELECVLHMKRLFDWGKHWTLCFVWLGVAQVKNNVNPPAADCWRPNIWKGKNCERINYLLIKSDVLEVLDHPIHSNEQNQQHKSPVSCHQEKIKCLKHFRLRDYEPLETFEFFFFFLFLVSTQSKFSDIVHWWWRRY